MYKLQIPHIIRDIEAVMYRVRVRHGNIRSQVQKLKQGRDPMESTNCEAWFEISKRFITVHTSHFSGYIVTVEGINCCSGSANVLLFGCLSNVPDEDPLATLKVYMSSGHSTQLEITKQ